MSLLFGTDWHLNFLTDKATENFIQNIYKENPTADGLILTGDISSGEALNKHMTMLAENFPKPIFFCLGNHDFYNKSFQYIDELTARLTKRFDNLYWLNQGSHIYKGSSIVGVNGWYDCRQGNSQTRIELRDFSAIEDLLAGLNNRDLLIELVRKRADKEANRLDALLFEEVCRFDSDVVFIATHVSPYSQSCLNEGEQSNSEWLPWFCSYVIGEVIDKYAENHTDKKFVVLCGHSHSPGTYRRRDNLVVYTGGTGNMGNNLYRHPDVVGWIYPDDRSIKSYNSKGILGITRY